MSQGQHRTSARHHGVMSGILTLTADTELQNGTCVQLGLRQHSSKTLSPEPLQTLGLGFRVEGIRV